MACFKRLGSRLMNSVEDAMDKVGDSFTEFLFKKYPDIDEVRIYTFIPEFFSTHFDSL